MANQFESKPFSSLEDMVGKPTWREVLLALISSNKIDPWNIDLVTLADAFLVKVKELEKVDFFLQANVILAAAILLKYKSEYLRLISQPPIEMLPETESFHVGPEEIPILSFSSRIPPRRPITLEELMQEMEKIIKYDDPNRLLNKVPRGGITETVDFEVSEHDVERDMAAILERVGQLSDHDGLSLFSRLTSGYEAQAVVYTLLCLLHLVQEGNLSLSQDEMFGEIFIRKKQASTPSS